MVTADSSTLFLFDGRVDDGFIGQEILATGCELRAMFGPPTLPRRLAKKLGFKNTLGRFLLSDGDFTATKNVIIFESQHAEKVAKWIKERQPAIRIIHWYWNPTPDSFEPPPGDLMETWSFDKSSAERHSLPSNTQFLFKSQVRQLEPETDVFFIGKDKGRADDIRRLEEQLQGQGLSTDIRISSESSTWIPYRDVIELSAKSRAILDIVQEGQEGLTLRAMEALFLGVKLITNNAAIREEQEYPQEMVFLLDGNVGEQLAAFVRNDRPVVAQSVIDHYDFVSWLGRFG